jgi:Na+-translocating ferredoxin:NAD+ oxidoreductase RnfC subunit
MNSKLIKQIEAAGVVGAGGAGFPTHVKLAAQAKTLIVNAAECEPLIAVDQQLLACKSEEFWHGLALAKQLTGATQVWIAIKAKHRELVSALKAAIKDVEQTEVFELADFYPAGDEQILVYTVTGQVVPRGGIPLAVGCIVINVETLINVARAQGNRAVTTSFVTVAGAVPEPATFELPVGTSYANALALTGAAPRPEQSVIDGGPMMGKLVSDLSLPIGKTTKAILLLDSDKQLVREKFVGDGAILKQSRTACEQCQKCTDLCPRELLGHDVKPHLIMRIVNYGLSDFQGMQRAFGCSECAACELYACPCGLSPRRVNMMVKQQLQAAGVKLQNASEEFKAAAQFDYRQIPVKRLVARLGLAAYAGTKAELRTTNFAPEQVSILLKQHIGAPATACVQPGDKVSAGDPVAQMTDGKLGAAAHASISGTVSAVSANAVIINRD